MIAPSEIHFIPLKCPSCGAPLEAGAASVLFYCLRCQKGSELREGKFHSFPLHFAPRIDPRGEPPAVASAKNHVIYLPFWVIEAQIEITTRQYTRIEPEMEYWRKFYARLKPFVPEANLTISEEAPPQTLNLFVPAFATTNIAAYTTNLGVALTRAQPSFEEGPPILPRPCIYDSWEALTLAEIIFLALETSESSHLLRLEFNLRPLRQELWALPFYLQEQFLIEPKTGVQMLTSGLEGEKKG